MATDVHEHVVDETLKERAEKRARAGDGEVAGLLALVHELEEEIARKDRVISEWESGKRTPRQEVWGYDG